LQWKREKIVAFVLFYCFYVKLLVVFKNNQKKKGPIKLVYFVMKIALKVSERYGTSAGEAH
jgi:hypothetical protein